MAGETLGGTSESETEVTPRFQPTMPGNVAGFGKALEQHKATKNTTRHDTTRHKHSKRHSGKVAKSTKDDSREGRTYDLDNNLAGWS